MAKQEIDLTENGRWFVSTFRGGIILMEKRREEEASPQPQFYPYERLDMRRLEAAEAKQNEIVRKRTIRKRTLFSATHQPKRTPLK